VWAVAAGAEAAVGIGDEQRGQRGLPALGNGAFDQPARLVAGDGRAGPLEQAARDLDRAAREQWGRVPAPSQAGQGLRAASGLLLAARFVQSAEASRLLALLAQVAALADSVTRMREAQGRAVQAAAARRAGEALQAAYTARIVLQAPPGRCCRRPAPGPPSLRCLQALTPATRGRTFCARPCAQPAPSRTWSSTRSLPPGRTDDGSPSTRCTRSAPPPKPQPRCPLTGSVAKSAGSPRPFAYHS